MARNEGDHLTGHMVGSMAPMMNQAVSNPVGVVAGFLLLGTVCVAIAIFQALGETWNAWSPFAIVATSFGAIAFGHFRLWGRALPRRQARWATAAAFVLAMLVVEGCYGQVGVTMWRMTGYNPRATLTALGVPTPMNVDVLIRKERDEVDHVEGCRQAVASGTMSDGTVTAVTWAKNCADSVPLQARQQACLKLRPDQIDAMARTDCGSMGIRLPAR